MITDINDNPPLISPVDILEITESDSLDTNILLTSLTVTDSDLSSELEYSISNNPDGAFSINNRGNKMINVSNMFEYFSRQICMS